MNNNIKNILLFIGIGISLLISFFVMGLTASNGYIFKNVFCCISVMILVALIISIPFWIYQETDRGSTK